MADLDRRILSPSEIHLRTRRVFTETGASLEGVTPEFYDETLTSVLMDLGRKNMGIEIANPDDDSVSQINGVEIGLRDYAATRVLVVGRSVDAGRESEPLFLVQTHDHKIITVWKSELGL